MSSERDTLKAAFLANAGLADAERTAVPGDASTRSYERLTTVGGQNVLLMDAPPLAESPPCDPAWTAEQRHAAGWNAIARLAAGSVAAFAAVARHLRSLELSAPAVHALDTQHGLAVVEDFGDSAFARMIERGVDGQAMYFAAVDALAVLHDAPTPQELLGPGGTWPLLTYDATALKAGANLFVEWLPKLKPELRFGPAAHAEWDALWTDIARRGETGAHVLAHRDFHAENLLWLPERKGAARVGMIDFQDAVVAHPSWDLHSLLQDARRDVPPELEAQALARYFDHRRNLDREAFLADYAALAALNEARILGVFARLVVRDGKARYLDFMPRMWRQLERNLQNPTLLELKTWFDRHAPVEARR